ncbi:MAG: RDD family protein [Thiohalomonadaceae bacterium]
MSEPRYAGFWRRVAAHLIDTLIFLPIALILVFLVYGGAYFEESAANAFGYHGAWDVFVNQVLPFILIVLLWARYGATPGKYLMRCRIVDLRSGGNPGIGRSALRYVAYLASFLPFLLGFLWVAWDRRKQGFHDKIAGTVVVITSQNEAEKSLDQLMKESGA